MERKQRRRHFERSLLCSGISFLLACSLSACAPRWTQVDCFAMDTYNVLQAEADEAVLRQAAARLNELETIFSRTREGAHLMKLNAAGSLAREQMNAELLEVLISAKTLAEETNHAFDPTLGRLVDLWDVGSETPRIPNEASIEQAKAACGLDKLALGKTITLTAGMQLDLGAIAKGYATDQLVALLEEQGVENALLTLGGNVYALGAKNGKPYTVGIANPAGDSELLGTLTVQDEAVITSGDYQRYFEQDGVRYHHILDRQMGAPAQSDLAAVTVVGPSALRADAYSTALFVLGLEAGLALVEADASLEAVFVKADGGIVVSTGLKTRFTKR